MNAPRGHAAGDSSFARSAGASAGRGLLLIVVAVAVGAFLLSQGFDNPVTVVDTGPTEPDASTDDTTTTDGTLPPAGRSPAETKVIVANGSGIDGAAGQETNVLVAAGYVTLDPTNNDTPADTTIVYYTDGWDLEATTLALTLGLDPALSVQPLAETLGFDPLDANIAVLLGADLAVPDE